jgi:hypothetical protein
MKTFLAGLLAIIFVSRATAQVSVEIATEQDQFLPSESVPLALKITNRSGQRLHLGADADWLTFSVEAADGFVVLKNSDVPVTGEFDLENGQLAIKRVDLQPYFALSKPGRYTVTATLHIRDWTERPPSAAKKFDVINGAKIWEQDFGLPTASGTPEARKYVLEKANYLKQQLRLYAQVSDAAEAQVFKVAALGPVVSFSQPEAQVDRQSRLNVLWQTGAQSYSFVTVNPDGTATPPVFYEIYPSRPKLGLTEDGDVVVTGGTLRRKPAELPPVKSPDELPHIVQPVSSDKK